jgi:hypothetical protein
MSEGKEPNRKKLKGESLPQPEGGGGAGDGGGEAPAAIGTGTPVTTDYIVHDIYFVGDDDALYKFPVDPNGGYTKPPETPAYSDPNLRHIHNVANPGRTEEPPLPRGPVFATLPITDEPTAASFITCYVINPKNLIYRNAYTAEEWFSPGAKEAPGPTIPDDFDLIVAGPKGRIYLMQVTGNGTKSTCRQLQRQELKHEMDLWEQLRNGTVVGRVLFGEKVVPMVNVTSVQSGSQPAQPGVRPEGGAE